MFLSIFRWKRKHSCFRVHYSIFLLIFAPNKIFAEVKIKEVLCALERFAPLPLQDGFDNAGLQIGLTEAEITGALLCLDVTEAVVDEAIQLGYNLIVSHHPVLFHGLKSITGSTYIERCVMKAIKHDIVIYSAHTNLDNAPEGVNFEIARRLQLKEVQILSPKQPGADFGSGVIGVLEQPEEEISFLKRVKETFRVGCVLHSAGTGRKVRKVAICGGAGSFLIDEALAQQADVFLTGEIKYHEFFGHDGEILLAAIGHYESEQYTRELLQELLRRECPELQTKITNINTNPINYL